MISNRQKKSELKKLIKETEQIIDIKKRDLKELQNEIKLCDYNIMVNKDENRKTQRLLKGRYVTFKNMNRYDFYEVVEINNDTCKLRLLPKVSYSKTGIDIVCSKEWVKVNIKNRDTKLLEKLFI